MTRTSGRVLIGSVLLLFAMVTAAGAVDCGDTIVADVTLVGADGITTTICPGDGLIIDGDGITVDLSGFTIRGSGGGTGIKILAGSDNVILQNGQITGFAKGIGGTMVCTLPDPQDCKIENVTVTGNDVGVDLLGTRATLDTVKAVANTGDGILVNGSSNRVVDHVLATGNGGHGIVLIGNGALVENSLATGNGGDGIRVQGDLGTVLNNDMYTNGGDGLAVIGNRNLVKKNDGGDKGKGNVGDGIRVTGGGNTVRENRLYANGGYGIEVTGGTAAIANILLKNLVGDRGRGNALHGIFVHLDKGNGTPDPVEIQGNVVKSSGQSGIVVKTSPAGVASAETIGNVTPASTTVVIGVLPTTLGFTASGQAVLGGVDTFAYSGVNAFGFTGVLAIDANFPAGTEVTQAAAGSPSQTTGHELKGNQSGGSGDLRNALCQYDVESGNFNARSNKANGVLVKPDIDGAAFPTGCL